MFVKEFLKVRIFCPKSAYFHLKHLKEGAKDINDPNNVFFTTACNYFYNMNEMAEMQCMPERERETSEELFGLLWRRL